MALTAGTKLGPYEILGELGAGGMGEVYRARDTRLHRTVAVKILPEHLSADVGRRARFEREARTISGLSHPNICALFDIGDQGGVYYVVLEYLEGKTLADRIAKGPMPVSEVLKVGADIASALETAHRNGIVHRDLKPANVMLTKTGTKLLDFGLAKPSAALAPAAAGDAPTVSKSLTEEGVIVGTFRYMAPEQLEGKDTDGRTDIFALGALLYEMGTARNAFNGASRASIIAAILLFAIFGKLSDLGLAALGRLSQTLVITHLPQVAAAGEAQFVLTKGIDDHGLARTEIIEVAGDARVDELCRMLGTTSNDPGAREHVVQLLRGVEVT